MSRLTALPRFSAGFSTELVRRPDSSPRRAASSDVRGGIPLPFSVLPFWLLSLLYYCLFKKTAPRAFEKRKPALRCEFIVMDTTNNDFIEDNPMAAPMQPRGDAWEQTKQKAVRVRERTEYFLRENPVPMILGALAAGVAIGMAIRYASGAEQKEKAKLPLDRINWSVLSLPFLWPVFKSLKQKCEDSAETVRENVDRLKKIDIERYAKPIRKRWKAWTN
jgi:hypothetical protein